MVQNPTPKDQTALLPLLRQDCSRVRSEGSTYAILSNLTSWKSVGRASGHGRTRKMSRKLPSMASQSWLLL